jgi:hypothetical protein
LDGGGLNFVNVANLPLAAIGTAYVESRCDDVSFHSPWRDRENNALLRNRAGATALKVMVDEICRHCRSAQSVPAPQCARDWQRIAAGTAAYQLHPNPR